MKFNLIILSVILIIICCKSTVKNEIEKSLLVKDLKSALIQHNDSLAHTLYVNRFYSYLDTLKFPEGKYIDNITLIEYYMNSGETTGNFNVLVGMSSTKGVILNSKYDRNKSTWTTLKLRLVDLKKAKDFDYNFRTSKNWPQNNKELDSTYLSIEDVIRYRHIERNQKPIILTAKNPKNALSADIISFVTNDSLTLR